MERSSTRHRTARAGLSRAARGALAVTCLFAVPLAAQLEPLREDSGATGLGLALRRLGRTGSVLYVTAHPDDEHNGLLVALGLGRGHRVGLLTLTRGEGGQNEIGTELYEALGVLRTAELMAVHRYDKVRQFFTRAFEFGYSFSVEETYDKWGRADTIGDIVRVIRAFRPDVVLTMMPTGEGGGQHHQASARLADEACRRAADPRHSGGDPGPWGVKKVYRVPFVRGGEAPEGALRVPVGEFDDLLGVSWAEYGAIARNHHRCQGMNAPPVPGEQWAYLLPVHASGSSASDDLFSPAEATFAALFGETVGASNPLREQLEELEAFARGARSAFATSRYGDVARTVMTGLAHVRRMRSRLEGAALEDEVRRDLEFRLAREEEDWSLAARRAHQLSLDVRVFPGDRSGGRVADGLVTRGETFLIEATLLNRGRTPVVIRSAEVEVPSGSWKVEPLTGGDGTTRYNRPVRWTWRVTVGGDARFTGPHWFRRDAFTYRYDTTAPPREALRPFLPPAVFVELGYASHGVGAELRRPAAYRWYDPLAAKRRSFALKVVPRVSVEVEPELAVLPLARSNVGREIEVRLHSHIHGDVSGEVELTTPAGWTVEPPSRPVRFRGENEEVTLSFRALPPEAVLPGDYTVTAVARVDGSEFSTGYRRIAYHHIETRHLYRPAAATLRVLDVEAAPDLRVGYVMGVGDEVPEAIRSLGAHLTMLEAADLAAGDLSVYDVIVTGIRAYKDRLDLIRNNRRLLERVREGGVMITQYNKYEFNAGAYAPYPLSISKPHDRVTDENAPVRILVPHSPVFLRPNRIGPDDWQGWIQERGLYFLGTWDERYTPLLEMEDPFPFNPGAKRGGLVLAHHGRGAYVYTGIGFFRQLPAGVPGAWRLFANLLSLPRTMDP